MAKNPIIASYDKVADVAYISVGEPMNRARYEEGERGIVWRLTVEGQKRGVTLLNFSVNWANRTDELFAILRENLPLGRSTAAEEKILEFA
jgi:hypothetical protein